VTAVRRRNVRTAAPAPDMLIEEGDIVVLLGSEAGVAAAEIRLLQG
jgi:K+/H+ antiporter YhaU regulatory subunit KhtT